MMLARPVLAGLIALALVPDGSARPQLSGVPDMARIVRQSADASRRQNDERRRSGGIKSAAGPFTVTQVDIPANDNGSGFFTGTGFPERIQIMTPFGFDPQGQDLPLILVFNGWGLSAFSFYNGMSDIPDEANLRGWLVVAVTCLDDKSYGWIAGQTGVAVALKYMIANYPVDEERIYGVGWSGGGGSIVSFAARHLDPGQPMLAAVATNAGTYDLVDTYYHVPLSIQLIMENQALFQGPPTGGTLWNYLRTQTETLNTLGGTLVEAQSQMRNLLNTPVYHAYSTDDTLTYLPGQNDIFRTFFTANGSDYTVQTYTGLPTPHTWDLLPGPTVLAWFDARVLDREPAAFRASADRDTAVFWASVELTDPGAFATLECAVDSVTNDLSITGVANVASLALDPPAVHFDPTADFDITFTSADPAATLVAIENVPVRPSEVLAGMTPFSNWTYAAADDELLVTMPAGGATLSVVFGDYTGVLSGPSSIAVGTNLVFELAGSTPAKPFALLIGQSAGTVPISLFDPGDHRELLVSLHPLPIFLPPATLDSAAEASIDVGAVPAGLAGTTLYCQFLTFPGGATIVDEISNRLDVSIAPSL